jgi:hypothetical protein
MKKLFIPLSILVSLFCFRSAHSQTFISKGTVTGGGSVTFSTGKYKYDFGSTYDVTQTSFSLAPNAQYYLADNFGLGARLGVHINSSNNKEFDTKSSSTQLTIGPVARYYFGEGPFVQLYFGIGTESGSFESGGSSGDSSEGIFEYDLGVGYSIRISDTILLDPMVGYNGNKHTDKDSDGSLAWGGIYIGASFTLLLINP